MPRIAIYQFFYQRPLPAGLHGGPQSTVIVICPLSQAWVKQSGSYLVLSKFRLVDLITCIKHNDWSSYDSGSDVWRWGKFKNVFFCCRLSLTEYFSIALCEWPFLLTSDKAWDVSSPLGSSMQSVLYQEMTLMQPKGSCVSSDDFQKRCCSSLTITFWNLAVVKKSWIF